MEIKELNMNDYSEVNEKPYLYNLVLNEFYRQMNMEAKLMNLKSTKFASAHGMHHD
jgi:hypothetical protein